MALRDKIREKIEPQLEQGETLRQVFVAQTGPSPYWLFLTYLCFFWIKYSVFAVTDRRILVFQSNSAFRVKELSGTLPRETRFGPVSGLWTKIEISGTSYWVHRRFQKDVKAADAALPTSATPAG
jgi:hypothetical protein